jgi:hypothetical protein
MLNHSAATVLPRRIELCLEHHTNPWYRRANARHALIADIQCGLSAPSRLEGPTASALSNAQSATQPKLS